MATLYELDNAFKNFELDIDYETGEILNAEEWEQLECDRATKLENTAIMYMMHLNKAKEHKEQEEKQARWRKGEERAAEWLKARLDDVLEGEKFETSRVRISYRKSERVEVSDGFNDERFMRYEPKVNKTAIKEALKSGETIEGAVLVESKNIQIK